MTDTQPPLKISGPDVGLPQIPSVTPLFKPILEVCSKTDILIKLYANGTVEILKEGAAPEAARIFWNSVRDTVIRVPTVNMLRDLTFLTAFIQGKGVWFSNPNEKLELYAWIGQIEQRYGLGDQSGRTR